MTLSKSSIWRTNLKKHICYIIFFIFSGFAAYAAETIPVFSPYLKTNPVYKDNLKARIKDKGFNPIFFSKYEEFNNFVNQTNPKHKVNLINKNVKNVQFLGKSLITIQAYSIKDVKTNKMDSLKVGMVNMQKEKTTLKQIKKATGSFPKVLRTVSKEQDLVPLLFFKSVDVIFLDSRSEKHLNKKFNIKLKKLKWSYPWGAEGIVKHEN